MRCAANISHTGLCGARTRRVSSARHREDERWITEWTRRVLQRLLQESAADSCLKPRVIPISDVCEAAAQLQKTGRAPSRAHALAAATSGHAEVQQYRDDAEHNNKARHGEAVKDHGNSFLTTLSNERIMILVHHKINSILNNEALAAREGFAYVVCATVAR